MLLQRLVEYTASHPGAAPAFHRERVFHWQLELTWDGRLRSRELTALRRTDDGGLVRGVLHVTPSAVRTVGVAGNLTADDVQYVLGWPDPDSKPARVAQCHAAFTDLIWRWADSDVGRGDPVAGAVAAFYRSGGLGEVNRPGEFTAKQGVVIAVDGTPAYRAVSVAPFWAGEVAARKGGGESGLCLVCGRIGSLLDTVPGKVPARLVPGAGNDAALVSVNERVFGYALTTKLMHTPLCMACGEAVSTGLRAVLESSHAMSYGGQDSRIAWWVTEPAEFDPMTLLQEPHADQVAVWRRAVKAGTELPVDDPGKRNLAKFCSLAVGGNVARVMVRDWVEMPLAALHANIGAWLDDHEIAARWENGKRHYGLSHLLLVSGRWQRDRKCYADFTAKNADRPPHAQRDLLRAAIRGSQIPPCLLAHLIRRVRSDGRLDEPRAALIRLALTRSHLITEKPMPDLDLTNTDPAYVCGRAFAVLEQIQYDASGGKLNTTYGDRYFSGAVTNPRAALVNGRKDAKAWLKKLRRNTSRQASHENEEQTRPDNKAYWHERTLDELFSLLDAGTGIPARCTLRQQASFLLGYHHQRAYRAEAIRARKLAAAGQGDDAEPDTGTEPTEETA